MIVLFELINGACLHRTNTTSVFLNLNGYRSATSTVCHVFFAFICFYVLVLNLFHIPYQMSRYSSISIRNMDVQSLVMNIKSLFILTSSYPRFSIIYIHAILSDFSHQDCCFEIRLLLRQKKSCKL